MIKKILILLFLLLITAYLIVAVTAFNTKPADQVCKGMELIIKDSIDHGFISQKEVLRLLNGKKLSPVGKKMGDINTRLLEEELSQHPLIENVECYRTPGCKIGIEVTQRLPILRVMANNGDNYYIDNKGKRTGTHWKNLCKDNCRTGHTTETEVVRKFEEIDPDRHNDRAQCYDEETF